MNSRRLLFGKDFRIIALLALTVMLSYASVLDVPFVFDDRSSVVENESIRHISTALVPPFDSGATVSGRPVLNFSFYLNYQVGEFRPFGYRLTNVGIHLGSMALLYGIVLGVLGMIGWQAASQRAVATATAALWALHPLQTESVCYVSQRAELLVSFFFLLSLYALLRSATSPRAKTWRVVSVLACGFGMGSKEVMFSAPLVLYLFDACFIARSWTMPWRERKLTYCLLMSTWLVLALCVWSSGVRGGTVGSTADVSAVQYFLTQCEAIVMYVKLAVWPHPLVFDYGTNVVAGLHEVLLEFTLLSVAFVLAIVWLKKRHWAGFLAVCVFALLAPSSSFVPVITQTVAEHRFYLALVGMVIPFVVGCFVFRRALAPVFCGGVALMLAVVTWFRTQDYRTAEALWLDTVNKRPQNQRAWSSLGACYAGRQDFVNAKRAIRRAMEIAPNDLGPIVNYAYLLGYLKDTSGAEAYYQKALALAPDWPITLQGYGKLLLEIGDPLRARTYLQRAVAVTPKSFEAWYTLGSSFVATAQYAEAITAYQKALNLSPYSQTTRNDLGLALLKAGRSAEALTLITESQQMYPKDTNLKRAEALVLIAMGKPERAITLLNDVMPSALSRPSVKADLGLALAAAKRDSDAVDAYSDALKEGYGADTPALRRAVYVSLAELWQRMGRYDNAAASLEEAIKLDPESKELRMALAGILLGGGDNRAAVVVLEQLIRGGGAGSDPDLHNNLGVAYMRQGDLDRAVREFKAALRINPSHVDAAENLHALEARVSD